MNNSLLNESTIVGTDVTINDKEVIPIVRMVFKAVNCTEGMVQILGTLQKVL